VAPFGSEEIAPLLGTRSRRNQLAVVRTRGGFLGENTKQPGGCLVDFPKIAASNMNNIVSFKGRQFTNKGASQGPDGRCSGWQAHRRTFGVLPIQLLGAQAILSKSFAMLDFNARFESGYCRLEPGHR
jgi:hypothetical protein